MKRRILYERGRDFAAGYSSCCDFAYGCVIVAIFISDKNKVPKSGSIHAEVVPKRIGRSYDKRVAQAGISGVCNFEYYVKFRLDGDKVLELQCPCKVYNRISEGDR
ncbi:MAG: hypothetical protein IJN68_04015 [Clostridia bacterium]|nr:hypothetical protein [Clostridia bacterium]